MGIDEYARSVLLARIMKAMIVHGQLRELHGCERAANIVEAVYRLFEQMTGDGDEHTVRARPTRLRSSQCRRTSIVMTSARVGSGA